MFSLVKGLAVTVLGIGGISTTVYGIAKASSSKSDFLSWKNKKLNVENPILTCGDQKYDIYEMLMKISEDGKNDMGLGITFEFKISKLDGKNETKPQETWIMQWGENAKEERHWEEWMVTFLNGKEDNVRYKEFKTRGNAFTTDQAAVGCKNSKIELKEPSKEQGAEEKVKNTEIKFEVDKKGCTWSSNSVTCDVVFNPDSKLKWKTGFRPRITFSY